ncbi:MAG: enoyl-[acyl-carrier-protein] reductase FabK, partial [Clostridia bacterium]|nr:enoyl-[acyl-carrier-protein] reductase FabK [Clostridia bacterium]
NIMLKSPYAAEVASIAAEQKVPVLTTGAGSPVKFMKMWLDAGIKVIPVVPSTAVAKLVERSGACAVVAEGGESGGHIGELSTMALVPQVVDAVGIPVIAAGGIANGRGFAAALMLGAVGAQLGTRFLVARECRIHPNYKKRILKARDIDTITTGKRLGHPVRSLKTPFSLDYFAKEYDSTISNDELEALGLGTLRLAVVEGDEQNGCFLAGQAAAMVNQEQTAQEIIVDLMKDTEKVLAGAGKWLK